MDLENHLRDFNRRDWQSKSVDGTLRIALIGLGFWTIDWAIPAIEKSDNCETTVVVSSSRGKADRVASKNNIPHSLTYDEFHEGGAKDEYDAIYIVTPNALHLPYVETAAKNGKAILCEKPVEASLDRAERLVEVCKSESVPLMVAYRMHTEPAVRRAKELIQHGFIGDPVLVQGNNSQPLLDIIPDKNQWRLKKDTVGYGTSLMDVGVYVLNTTRFLLDSDPVAVTSSLGSINEQFKNVPDERAAFACEFDDGTYMAGTASQNAYADTALEIIGTEGRIRLDPAFHMECGLTIERDGTEADISFEQADEMVEEFDYFADRVLTEGEIYPDGDHALVDMRTLKALYESGSTGRRVFVDEV